MSLSALADGIHELWFITLLRLLRLLPSLSFTTKFTNELGETDYLLNNSSMYSTIAIESYQKAAVKDWHYMCDFNSTHHIH